MRSPVRTFQVISTLQPPYLTAPQGGSIAVSRDAATAFTWQSVDGADYYNFNLYQGNDGGKAVYSASFITGSRLELPLGDYQEGPYTWTVQAFVQEKAATARLSSSLSSAEFYLQPLLPEVQRRRPENGYRIGPDQLRASRTITFSWNAVPEANAYIVTLYQGTGNTRRQIRRWDPSARTSLTLDDLSVLGNGSFIWQVEAVYRAANGSIERRGIVGENRFTVNLPALPRDTPKNPGKVYGQ
jgi:hypothetical protein